MYEVCSPWTTPDRLRCEGDVAADDCAGGTVPLARVWTDEELILAASNLLFGRTCRRFPGECTATVWPCIDFSCMSNSHPCAPCLRYDVAELPTDYTVSAIVAVIEGGVTLPPSSYRIEGRNLLVRLDGQRWKQNNFGLTADGIETTIEFTAGQPVPIELQIAAADLACELKGISNDSRSQLPPHVRAIARRGVSLELTDIVSLLKGGQTGIQSVDYALQVYGNCGGSSMHDPTRSVPGYQVR